MALISIILGLILDRHWKAIQALKQFHWFEQVTQSVLKAVEPHINLPAARYLLVLAVPVLPVLILQSFSDDWMLIFSVLFALVVFLMCLGSLDIEQTIEKLIDALTENNHDEAQRLINELSETENPPADQQLDEVIQSLLRQLTEKLFSVIFWFTVLGPVGAVIYRFSHELLKNQQANPVLQHYCERMITLLNWLPERCLALSFAMTGHFEGAHAAYNENKETDSNQKHLLLDVTHGALDGNDRESMAQYLAVFRGMILRSLIIWLTVIALVALIGWS